MKFRNISMSCRECAFNFCLIDSFLISLISSPANLSSTNCSVAKFTKSFLLKLFNNTNRPIEIEMYSSNIS